MAGAMAGVRRAASKHRGRHPPRMHGELPKVRRRGLHLLFLVSIIRRLNVKDVLPGKLVFGGSDGLATPQRVQVYEVVRDGTVHQGRMACNFRPFLLLGIIGTGIERVEFHTSETPDDGPAGTRAGGGVIPPS